MKNIVVVGAGLSGLSAAYQLDKAGYKVTVLESNDRPGGRVRTDRQDGFIIDAGPDAMSESYTDFIALLNDVGLGDTLVPSSPVVGIIRDKRVFDIDRNALFKAVFTPALSLMAKLKLIKGAAKLRKQIAKIDSFSLTNFSELDDPNVNAAEFSEQHFGNEAAKYLIDPMMRLTVGTGAAGASSLNVVGALGSWASKLVNVKGGLDKLPRALANKLNIIYDAKVQNIENDNSGVRVNWTDASGKSQTLNADACVLACMLHNARKIWPALREPSDKFYDALTNLSLISISLAYSSPSPSKAYVIQSPTCEFDDVLLIFQQHRKAPDRAPQGHSLITLYTDGKVTSSYLKKNDEDLESWGRKIIEELFPKMSEDFQFSHITRWPYAGYMATPGYWRRSKSLIELIPENSNIWLAGDLFGAGSMESAVRRGRVVAEDIIRKTPLMARNPFKGKSPQPAYGSV